MTPAEIYTSIRYQCAEDSENFWSEAEIYSLMSDAEKQIAQRIGNIKASTSISAISGTKTYDITSAVTGVITRMTYDSYRLEGISLNAIDDVEGSAYGGVTLSGPPVYYYRYGNTIGLSPTPDEDKTLDIYYEKVPDTITTASSNFEIPGEYTQYIKDYCLYRMMLKDQELQNEAIIYKRQWDENLSIIDVNYNKQNYRDNKRYVVVNEALVY